jgi:hypothetical protein
MPGAGRDWAGGARGATAAPQGPRGPGCHRSARRAPRKGRPQAMHRPPHAPPRARGAPHRPPPRGRRTSQAGGCEPRPPSPIQRCKQRLPSPLAFAAGAAPSLPQLHAAARPRLGANRCKARNPHYIRFRLGHGLSRDRQRRAAALLPLRSSAGSSGIVGVAPRGVPGWVGFFFREAAAFRGSFAWHWAINGAGAARPGGPPLCGPSNSARGRGGLGVQGIDLYNLVFLMTLNLRPAITGRW